MGANGELAQNISGKPPWWATAPIWLAAGIVGVPSLMAIGMGYFVAGSVSHHLNQIHEQNAAELHRLDIIQTNQGQYWEIVRRTLQMGVEIQLRTCIHEAADQKERDDCLKGVSSIPNVNPMK